MYELLILGVLMSRDMSGYKLGRILGSTLVPRRELSNGVMYPMLKKLAEAGDIVLSVNANSARHEKMAHITGQGQQHLQALMAAPVPLDAQRESIYHFKLRSLPALNPAEQRQILADYAKTVKADLAVYEAVRTHLKTRSPSDAAAPSDPRFIASTIATLELDIALCHTKLTWLAAQGQPHNTESQVTHE